MTTAKQLAYLLGALTLGFLLFTGCDISKPNNPNSSEKKGSAEVSIQLGKVGALAKKSAIDLNTLTLTLSATGETPVTQVIALSGSAQQTVTKIFDNLASQKEWILTAVTKDIEGMVIHSGTKAFTVPIEAVANVSLNLDAQYSMLKANLFPIRDSVTICSLSVDGQGVAGLSFAKGSRVGDTVNLSYDYLSATASGVLHTLVISAYGEMWGKQQLLYKGETTITAVSGVDQSSTITLSWVGPSTPPTGGASITVTLGAIGTITVNAELEGAAIVPPVTPPNTFTDPRDGKLYKTVTIGTQTWMAENLAYLPQVDAMADGSENVANGKYYYVYGYTPSGATEAEQVANAKVTANYTKYGVLYNWHAVKTGNIAPPGWHVPTEAEWDTLQNYLIANGYNWDNTTSGNKIAKSMAAQTDWIGSTFQGAIGNDLSKKQCQHVFGFAGRLSLQQWKFLQHW